MIFSCEFLHDLQSKRFDTRIEADDKIISLDLADSITFFGGFETST